MDDQVKSLHKYVTGEQHKVFGEIQADPVDRYNDMININCRLDHCVLPH